MNRGRHRGRGGLLTRYGPELVVNGDGSSAASWSTVGDASISVTGGRLRVTAGATVASVGAAARQVVPLEVGASYRLTGSMWASNSSFARVQAIGSPGVIISHTGSNPTTFEQDFVASSDCDLNLGVATPGAWGNPGDYAEFDNISVRKLL